MAEIRTRPIAQTGASRPAFVNQGSSSLAPAMVSTPTTMI